METQDAAKPVVLIVEDEVLLAMATEDLLIAGGFNTLTAYTETQAQAQAPASLTVAVVDIKLNGDLTGPHVIQHLRSGRPNLPVVVVTGYNRTAPQADLRGLGGPTERLMKPVSQDDLSAAVRDVIDRDRHGTPSLSGRRRSDTKPAQ